MGNLINMSRGGTSRAPRGGTTRAPRKTFGGGNLIPANFYRRAPRGKGTPRDEPSDNCMSDKVSCPPGTICDKKTGNCGPLTIDWGEL